MAFIHLELVDFFRRFPKSWGYPRHHHGWWTNTKSWSSMTDDAFGGISWIGKVHLVSFTHLGGFFGGSGSFHGESTHRTKHGKTVLGTPQDQIVFFHFNPSIIPQNWGMPKSSRQPKIVDFLGCFGRLLRMCPLRFAWATGSGAHRLFRQQSYADWNNKHTGWANQIGIEWELTCTMVEKGWLLENWSKIMGDWTKMPSQTETQ